jgi:hypothetical protein
MLDAYTMLNARAFSGASFSMPNSVVSDFMGPTVREVQFAVKHGKRWGNGVLE